MDVPKPDTEMEDGAPAALGTKATGAGLANPAALAGCVIPPVSDAMVITKAIERPTTTRDANNSFSPMLSLPIGFDETEGTLCGPACDLICEKRGRPLACRFRWRR